MPVGGPGNAARPVRLIRCRPQEARHVPALAPPSVDGGRGSGRSRDWALLYHCAFLLLLFWHEGASLGSAQSNCSTAVG